ncbi:Uncharacterized protein Fot_26886 [Forsythia ovata]|uniref:Uncharacterized protein n=1 Tax=Forsythia ovata TaxID=205694 RepID=A0ABD1UEM7_9LAMI
MRVKGVADLNAHVMKLSERLDKVEDEIRFVRQARNMRTSWNNPRPSKNMDEHTFSAKKSTTNWARKVSEQAVDLGGTSASWSGVGVTETFIGDKISNPMRKSATLWSRKVSKQAADLGEISARWSRGHRKINNGR